MSKKPKPAGQDEDDSTIRLPIVYKKKCQFNNVLMNKLFREKVEAAQQQGHLQSLQLWEDMGPVGVRALADAFSDLNYKHLKILRLWKVRAGDEGVRCICNFMEKTKTLELLDLLDNDITALGCEFLGRILRPEVGLPLLKLKLNHNGFGTEGLENLAVGLSTNKVLEKLSLKYCGIDSEGAKPLQRILANIDTKLQGLKLQGNQLRNDGTLELFRALHINSVLQKVSVGDNMVNLMSTGGQLINKICDVIRTNTILMHYDFADNMTSEENAKRIINEVRINANVCIVRLWNQLPREVQEQIALVLKKRKPKKRKDKKKKKKK